MNAETKTSGDGNPQDNVAMLLELLHRMVIRKASGSLIAVLESGVLVRIEKTETQNLVAAEPPRNVERR